MTTLCGISGTNLCFSVSIVTISPVCDWYRFHICIIYLFVSNVNVIYGTGSIVECKKIKVIFMQLAQTRPFYYFSLLLDPFGPGSALSISRLFYCIFISHTFSRYHFKAYDLFFWYRFLSYHLKKSLRSQIAQSIGVKTQGGKLWRQQIAFILAAKPGY